MSADVNPLQYWTPGAPPAAPGTAFPGGVRPLFSGPDRVGCVTMAGITFAAAVLAMTIVSLLGWVLA